MEIEFAIIGSGMAGCKLAYHISQFASCVLIEKKNQIKPYSKAKIICKHSWKWYSNLNIEDPDSPKIQFFPHWKTIYASRNREVFIDGNEFGEQLGVVINEFDVRDWYLRNSNQKNLKIIWNTECIDIQQLTTEKEKEKSTSNKDKKKKWQLILKNNSPNSTDELISSENIFNVQENLQKIEANCIILATGSSSLTSPKLDSSNLSNSSNSYNSYNSSNSSNSLHKILGFSKPQSLNTIVCSFYAPKEILDQNLPMQYLYRLHPQISKSGMLFINRFIDFFDIGFVDERPYSEMAEKFLRILKNYAPIQPFLQQVTPNPRELSNQDFIFGTTSIGRIPSLVQDGAAVVGDAGGLLYSMYFEGTVGIGASTTILAEVLQEIFNKGESYSEQNLKEYEKQLEISIGKRYLTAGKMARELFFLFGETPPFSIWDTYLQNIEDIRKVRKNIHHAYVYPHLDKYPIDNDLWVGEKLFQRLPAAKKFVLLPKFLEFKLKYSF
ncbi:NAD(P)/FAD-dependent oxidoreductase [Candidatus Harpocratesius sp.]